MQGFVLEGYPKNKEQFDNLKNMKLAPTMVVAIDTPREASQGRSNVDHDTFQTR
jgi:adenylate kinase family enzyme